jgi:hypothetical protein
MPEQGTSASVPAPEEPPNLQVQAGEEKSEREGEEEETKRKGWPGRAWALTVRRMLVLKTSQAMSAVQRAFITKLAASSRGRWGRCHCLYRCHFLLFLRCPETEDSGLLSRTPSGCYNAEKDE